jgi:hypothetical protein
MLGTVVFLALVSPASAEMAKDGEFDFTYALLEARR